MARRFSPPPAPQPVSAQEPPPWAEEVVPDDFAAANPPQDAMVPAIEGLPHNPPHNPPHDLPQAVPARAAASATSPVPAPLPSLQTTPLGDRWAALVRPMVAAGNLVAMVRELAWQAGLLAVTPAEGGGQRWTLCAERESLRNPSLAAKLSAALADALGEAALVEVVPGVAQDSIARRDALARETAQREAEQLIHNDPEVRSLMAQFRTARIVPGSIKPLAADGGLQPTPKASPP